MKEDLDSQLVSALLGLFAHDLRNPLSALHSNVSFLGSVVGTAETEVLEALEDVAASSDALGHITDNLELLSLALDGAAPREPHEVTVSELMRDSVQRARRFADSYRVKLDVDLDSAKGLKAVAHRDMLQRALGNLIRNAIQHAGESGTVSLSARSEAGEVLLCVVDSGVPLAADIGDSAFTAAGQLTTKNVAGGRYSRGLGLYAARIAAEVAGAGVRKGNGGCHFELCVKAR